jgi:Toastrack DUF4097
VRASKVGLLVLILAFGAVVETAWQVRGEWDFGPAGCRVLGGRFYGPHFGFEVERRLEVPEAAAVHVQNAFGSVKVSLGEAGAVTVRLRKEVYLPTEAEAREFADRVELQLVREGPVVRISTNRDRLGRPGERVGLETHIEVRLPPGTRVRIGNDHGGVDVADVAQAEVTSSYEPVEVRRVAGSLELAVRHGRVAVTGVGGPVTLSARYGDVEVEDVDGPVGIETEHGDVAVRRCAALTGSVHHGDLTAESVRGDIEIEGRHAGVHASGVGGSAHVETTYRDVRLEKVGGEVRVKAEHGQVSATEVTGPLVAEASYDDVVLAGISGPVELTVSHGGVRAEDLRQGARVRCSGDDVVLSRFAGPVEIAADRGSVRLTPDAPFLGPLAVRSTYGGIRLDVPPGSRFELDASAKGGEVDVELADLDPQRREPRRVIGHLGGGGLPVTLAAERGDVNVRSSSEVARQDR